MHDYFEIVVPRQTQDPIAYIELAEWGTATVLCARKRVRITFEMTFPSQEHMDSFLEARRTHRYAQYGGRITALTPTHLSEQIPSSESEDGDSLVLGIRQLAEVFGVTEKEFKAARTLAESAILSKYRFGRRRAST